MQIKVERWYQDTGGIVIPSGLYDENEPRLKGMGKWLVQNGYAIELQETVGTPYAIGINLASDEPELTVAMALTDEQEMSIVSDSPELEEIDLRQRYEELTGRAPHPAMKLETLRAKVAELEA